MFGRLRRWWPRAGEFRRRTRIEGIRARLGFSMALALLPFILLALVQVRSEFQTRNEALQADLIVAANRNIRDAEGIFTRVGVLLNIIAPEGQMFDCDGRMSALVLQIDEITALHRLDKEGNLLCTSDRSDGERFANSQALPWFRALSMPRPHDRTLLHLDEPESEIALVQRATRPLGDFDGALIAVIPTSKLAQAGQDANLPPDTTAVLYDGQGRPLSDEKAAWQVARLDDFQSWLAQQGGDKPTVFRHKGEDGRTRIFAASRFRDQDVYAVVSAPAPSPWSWARYNPIRFLALPLAAWLTAFAAAMLASERTVIRWLDYLDRIAAIYAKGRYTIRPDQASNAPLEIRHLAFTMDEMADNITRRDAALTEALQEKDALLREIHHRVKNNLQIISSLLSMQQRAVDDPAARAALGDTRQRIAALALIYRTLYQGEDVRHAEAGVFLNELVGHLVSSESLRGPMVKSSVEADTLDIDPDKLAPMALWLVEAISNAQKHAFAGRGGELKVRFHVQGDTSVIEVEDDGPGMDGESTGVGLTLMTAFAKQLRGTASTGPGPNGGTLARLEFETPRLVEHGPGIPAL